MTIFHHTRTFLCLSLCCAASLSLSQGPFSDCSTSDRRLEVVKPPQNLRSQHKDNLALAVATVTKLERYATAPPDFN